MAIILISVISIVFLLLAFPVLILREVVAVSIALSIPSPHFLVVLGVVVVLIPHSQVLFNEGDGDFSSKGLAINFFHIGVIYFFGGHSDPFLQIDVVFRVRGCFKTENMDVLFRVLFY